MKKVLGIDPGISGAFVLTNGIELESWPMPIITNGKDKFIHYAGVLKLLCKLVRAEPSLHVYLERAIPMAQGAKSAFNYGKGFAALEIALETLQMTVTYVEPQKWAKVMHEGISSDLKPKAKSLIAVKRLYPRLVKLLPTNTKGRLLDGPVDALLIAAYGLRTGYIPKVISNEDFF